MPVLRFNVPPVVIGTVLGVPLIVVGLEVVRQVP